nr:acyl-CoA dehydrogenase family protein [Nocardioides panzhihuensis]
MSSTVGPEEIEAALVLVRLGLATRALAAARRTHELAIEHSKNRVQFGKQIGSFQAVQQRTASCHIDVTAAELLIERAGEACLAGTADWTLSTELATDFTTAAARRIQFGAHHTLAAVGYFEEHEGPWLFRRVHADIARIPAFEPGSGTTVDRLLEGGAGLPDFTLDEVGESFRAEVTRAIDDLRGPRGRDDFDETEAIADFAGRGWFGVGWPEAYGGRSASLTEQVVLHDEIAYNRVPVKWTLSSVMLLGNSILLHGTEEQKERFFPIIRADKLKYCLGYSEPEVGSDLASVATRAVRSGDDWVINGQKIWTTNAHTAKYIWLATRTDPEAKPRHAGITMFLVPMDTPGITVQQMTSLSGEVSCAVLLDDVRVPDSARVGDENGGWKVITNALVGERISMGGIATQLHRQLDDLLVSLRADLDGLVGPRGSAGRTSLRSMVANLQAAPCAGGLRDRFGGERAGKPPGRPDGRGLRRRARRDLERVAARPAGPDRPVRRLQPRGAGRRGRRAAAAYLDHVRRRWRHQRHPTGAHRPRARPSQVKPPPNSQERP